MSAVELYESSVPPMATRCPPSVVRVDRVTGRSLIYRHTPGSLARERLCRLAPND